jgi:hypothetical protein
MMLASNPPIIYLYLCFCLGVGVKHFEKAKVRN